MVTVAFLYIITAAVIFFFLVPEPEMVGIIVEEYAEEKEAIIDAV